MIKSGHGAMLEHGTVYLKVTYKDTDFVTLSMFYGHNKYSKATHSEDNKVYYITTNYRELLKNNHLGDLKYLCEPTEFHEKRVCVHFILDRAIAMEFIRHRTFSFSMESTRYCNYSKDKFNNEIAYILPSWCNYEEGDYGIVSNPTRKNVGNQDGVFYEFVQSLLESEHRYFNLLRDGWKPQEARAVLPNALKTELVMTGFVSDWKHFFRLRSRIAKTGKPHPQAQELADPLMDEFVKRGIMETPL